MAGSHSEHSRPPLYSVPYDHAVDFHPTTAGMNPRDEVVPFGVALRGIWWGCGNPVDRKLHHPLAIVELDEDWRVRFVSKESHFLQEYVESSGFVITLEKSVQEGHFSRAKCFACENGLRG